MRAFEERFVRRLLAMANPNRHAVRKGKNYVHVCEPVSEHQITAHVTGGQAIAMHPLVGSTTRIGTFDADDKTKVVGIDGMIAIGQRIVAELEGRGLRSQLLLSGSGEAVHVFVLWQEPQDAALVRRFMANVLAACEFQIGTGSVHRGQVEIYPKQASEGEKGGNPIAVPLGRKSRLIFHGLPVETLHEEVAFDELLNAPLNPLAYPPDPPRVAVARAAQPPRPEVMESLLAAIPADDHDEWIRVGMILRAELGDDHFETWRKWSSTSEKYDERACRYRWGTFSETSALTLGSLFHLAKTYGWEPDLLGEVHEVNSRYGILAAGKNTQIIEKMPKHGADKLLSLIGVRPFRDRLRGEEGLLGSNDKRSKGGKGGAWMEHPEASRFHAVDFDPGLPPGENGELWNMWRGFNLKPAPGDWSSFRAFIEEVIAAGDPTKAKWVLNWMAWVVQNPSDPIGTAPVLTGRPGIGKGFFANAFGHLWGPHYLTVTDPAHVTGKFNGFMAGRKVIFVDECAMTANRGGVGVMKTRITERTIMFEQKGENAVPLINRSCWIMASNEHSVLPPDRGDRRYMMLDVADTRKEDRLFFGAVAKALRNGGYEAMLWDLLTMDLSAGPDPRRIIRGSSLFEQYMEAAPVYERYIYALLDEGYLPTHAPNLPNVSNTMALFEDFRVRHGNPFGTSDAALMKRIVRILKTERLGQAVHGTSRTTAHRFPSLSAARQAFVQYVGMDVVWHEPDGDWKVGPDNPIIGVPKQ